MNDAEVLAYVKASAALVALPLDDTRARAVAAHLARTVALARLIEQADLVPPDEPAEIFRPAPFPAEDEA